MNNKSIRTSLVEILLGVGLGLGFVTTLRFAGLIGPSEVLIALAIVVLFYKNKRKLFIFNRNIEGFVKLYLLATFTVISYATTFVAAIFTNLTSTPEYLVSFTMGVLLLFLLNDAINENFNLKLFVCVFAATFLIVNIIAFNFFETIYGDSRYTGGANNPNQLVFYATSIILLLVLYRTNFSLFAIPFIIYFALKTNSDTFFLFIGMAILCYLYLTIFFSNRFKYKIKLFAAILCVFILASLLVVNYSEEIIELWDFADGGGNSESVRLNLLVNGFYATLASPVFGLGVGSFSGPASIFEGWEAHNTFIDFSMQFGIAVSLIFYFILIKSFFMKIQSGFYLQAACILAFIISSLFHYTGRHFYFWVEMAIFYNYVFHSNSLRRYHN